MKKVMKAYDALHAVELVSADELVQAVEAQIMPKGARGNVTAQYPNGISTYEDAQKGKEELFAAYGY